MPESDYRALCAELLVALKSWSPHGGGPLECWEDREEEAALIARTEAALARPEPAAPTDEEIAQFAVEWWKNMQGFAPHKNETVYTVFEFVAREHFADFARDVLAEWSHH